MKGLTTSAPGKLFLCGEYAVLEGGPAVVTAVDRRAVASFCAKRRGSSAVVKAVRATVGNFLGPVAGKGSTSPLSILVETDGFDNGRHKMGLGSSAAVAAAVTGLLMEAAGKPIASHEHDIVTLARKAHRSAQGGRGSGADVVTSVLGGTVLFDGPLGQRSLHSPPVHLAFVWTGKSASTPRLLEKLADYKRYDPTGYRRHMESLAAVARAWVAAFENVKIDDLISLTGDYGAKMKALGEACDAPIVTGEHAHLAALAAACGGGAKPSGAGGGDTAVAVFENAPDAHRFGLQCASQGFALLDLAPHAPGLRTLPI